MKKLVARLANRLGYEIVPHWRMDGLAMARRLRGIFAYHHIERVIDVGANEGQFYNFLRWQVGFTGQVVSFEPVPQLAARLRERSASDPSWTIHACALGSVSSEMTLNVTAMSVFSSFLQPNTDDPSTGGNVVVDTVRVPVRTLDEMFPDPTALRRTYLKLDSQGFDLEIAKGAGQVLAAIPALQTEMSFRPVYNNMPDYRQSLTAFEAHGFRVADFYLVTTTPEGVAYELDCIFVRPVDPPPGA
ncbi:MAG TPA: FkbM family methyltransferase [Acetobacteraceae bacterium]|jgi:FkbM family methyltransferase|nr:FkbM family methyltransferase [Acetobacteraceae bacterium]